MSGLVGPSFLNPAAVNIPDLQKAAASTSTPLFNNPAASAAAVVAEA